jgi:carboxyl-terminal processing protease
VVLINRGSASASEIVAGAIQDLDRGVIIGQRSYGKGLVQITRPLSYNTQLKVTTAKYYIPSGRCIQAIDFSSRNEDGSVGLVPDSLISEFKTRNGRIVRDGGGITPDIEVVPETLSQVATELYMRNYIFDYATLYYRLHPVLSSIKNFRITDQDYADFGNYLKKRKFSYTTGTEASLNELIESAKSEKYYEVHKELLTELQNDLAHDLDKDLSIFRNEISSLLADEIIGRYFYDEGSISYSLSDDVQVLKAVETLRNKELFTSLLNGKSGAITLAGKEN